MFSKGQKVVYGQTGVCEITDICDKELTPFNVKTYYVLKPIYQQNSTIYCPIDNDKVHMRNIMTKEQAEKLIELIPTVKTKDFSGDAQKEVAEEYRKAVNCDDCSELIVLTMSIYAKKQAAKEMNKKIGTVDERYMQRAEELLFGELAASLEIDANEVQEYIKNRLKAKKLI